jgi:histidine triad (HIT) family protein
MNADGDTIFSKIMRKEIPAQIVFESETVVAFRDINPQAPVHVLIVPRKLLKDVSAAEQDDRALLAARQVAAQEGLAGKGYRLVINNGKDAGQEVPHLHVHLLGGRKMGWPPG